MATKIQWTDQTWNPVIGCRRVSEGCRNCYAETMAARLVSMGQERYRAVVDVDKRRWNGRAATVPEKLGEPLRWRKPRLVFVNSMSDLFHEDVPFEYVDEVMATMAATPQHTYQVLTKRPARLLEYARRVAASTPHDEVNARVFDLANATSGGFATWPLPNVWLGVSVEDQATADERIPLLLQCPAAVRWVSYEPALGPVDYSRWLRARSWHRFAYRAPDGGYNLGSGVHYFGCERAPEYDVPEGVALSWIVVGGESGPGARPFDVEWARSTVRAGREAGVPVFVKQLGSYPTWGRFGGSSLSAYHSRIAGGVHDRKGGDPSEWPEDLRVREWPEAVPA